MKEQINKLALQAREHADSLLGKGLPDMVWQDEYHQKFAHLIVQECIDRIETYQIPVGNSPSGEMACEWTYDALKEIRDQIKEHFGVKG